jgi:hypothetical protein
MRSTNGIFTARYALVLLVALEAAPAWAGPAVATPALPAPPSGGLHCLISNASDTKTIEVEWGLYDHKGDAKWGPVLTELEPLGNLYSGNGVNTQSTCVVRVLKGGKGNLRVSLTAEDSAGNIQAVAVGR